jgi:hypothetical protein
VQQDIICEPVELIDEDLDAVAGGFQVNFAEIEQSILQLADVDHGSSTQVAAQVASISQSNDS